MSFSFSYHRYCFLIVGCFIWVLIGSKSDGKDKNEKDERERPNIVLIMTDDQGFETVGAYGGESYETPVLNNLAETGIRFDQAHATPVCTPTRVQLMSGRYNSRNYIQFGKMDSTVYTFGNLFQDAGYATFIGGKWQLGGGLEAPYKFGFNEYTLWQVTRRPNRYANPGLEINGEEKDFKNGEYGSDIINKQVLDFIGRHPNEPFLVYYPMNLTHWPFEPSPDSPDWDPTHRREHEAERSLEGDCDPKYFGDMVEYADKLVGKVINKLEQMGLCENTLVFFTSDNGTSRSVTSRLNRKEFVGGKLTSTEAGTHVPLIANWPGIIPEGTVNKDLICFTYFFPTLAKVAGIEVPEDLNLDGQGFAPVLHGEETYLRDWLYMWWYRNNDPEGPGDEFARTHRYKYYRDGRFYDLKKDPLEENSPVEKEQFTGAQSYLLHVWRQ